MPGRFSEAIAKVVFEECVLGILSITPGAPSTVSRLVLSNGHPVAQPQSESIIMDSPSRFSAGKEDIYVTASTDIHLSFFLSLIRSGINNTAHLLPRQLRIECQCDLGKP